MAGKVGYCTQCDKQLMVADTNGKLNSVKPDCCQADLTMKNGARIRVLICKSCSDSPDLNKIFTTVVHPSSGLINGEKAMNYIHEKCGEPVGLTNVNRRRF